MKKSLLSLAVIATIGATNMFAGDVRVSGFANIIGGQIDNVEVGANTVSSKPGFGGYSNDNFEFQPHSLAGIQISSDVTDDMSVTTQIIARYEDEKSMVGLEWAYVNYTLIDDVTIQAGRFLPEMLLFSNTVNVGYSYLWIAPPTDMYTMTFMKYTDGINLLYSHEFDNEMALSTSLYYSNTNQEIKTSLGAVRNFQYDNTCGATIALSHEYFKVRAGVHARTVTMTGVDWDAIAKKNGITTGLTPEQLSHLDINKAQAIFANIAFSVDYEDVIVIAEYTAKTFEDTVAVEESNSYYATLGYRIGDFTPHITYSALDNTPKYTGDAYVDAARSMKAIDSQTNIIGLRYDINAYSDVKVEYQNINRTPHDKHEVANQVETSANLYKVALNIVF